MTITLPSITNFSDFILWVDELSGNIIGPVMCLLLFSLVFLSRQNEGTVNAFLLSSFSAMVLGIILSLIPLITPPMVTMLISLTLIAAAVRVFVE